MLLVFLISIDIKMEVNGIVEKKTVKNSSILCGRDDGVVLTQSISFAKTCGTAYNFHNVVFGSSRHVLRKRINA